MATLTLPAQAKVGTVANVTGTSFLNRKTRLALDGVGVGSNVFRPDSNGWFQVGIVVSSTPKTQTLVAQQYQGGGVWTEVARTTIDVVASVGFVLVDPPGWKRVFYDEFDTDVPLGHFMDGATETSEGWLTADKRYSMAKPQWNDTSGRGTRGDGSIIEVTGGRMIQHAYTDANKWGHNAILTLRPTGGSVKGGILGARFLIRHRMVTALPGHKSVPLGWPDVQSGSMDPETYGEIDLAEASWDKAPKAFMHSADGYNSNRQAYFSYPAGVTFRDYHDYVIEWLPGVSVTYLCDDALVGQVKEGDIWSGNPIHIPKVAMHWNLQFETSTDGEALVANTKGDIEIERVALWVPA